MQESRNWQIQILFVCAISPLAVESVSLLLFHRQVFTFMTPQNPIAERKFEQAPGVRNYTSSPDKSA